MYRSIPPLSPKLLDRLDEEKLALEKIIGYGTSNVAYQAVSLKYGEVCAIISIYKEFPEKNAMTIMRLQAQGKLNAVMKIYNWFHVVENESDCLGYNVIIAEILELDENEVIKGIDECIQSLTNDGWKQLDDHLGNFGVSVDGKVKTMDVETLIRIT